MVGLKNIWSPVGHIITATGETVKEVAGTAGNVTKRVINGARKIGNSWVSHSDKIVKALPKKRGTTKKMKGGKPPRKRGGKSRRQRR